MKVSHLHSSCQRLTAHVDPGSVCAELDRIAVPVIAVGSSRR